MKQGTKASESLPINISAITFSEGGISGGDRLFIECARRWAQKGCQVNIFVCKAGLRNCQRNKLEGVNYVLWSVDGLERLGFTNVLIPKLVVGCIKALIYKPAKVSKQVFFSPSDFWTDVFPACIMKLKRRNAKWVAAFHMVSANPFYGSEQEFVERKRLKRPRGWGIVYKLVQLFSIFLMKNFADLILADSRTVKEYLIHKGIAGNKIIDEPHDGIDFNAIQIIAPPSESPYIASYVGRFHPQKGNLDLVEIWDRVCKRKKQAKLALIGVGYRDLELKVRREIKIRGLEENIDLLGYVDGKDKFEILKGTKVFLFPSYYESFGIAVAEAIAAGVPVVAYDLPPYRAVFKEGMITVPLGDKEQFAEKVLELLDNEGLRQEISEKGKEIIKNYSWDRIADRILGLMNALYRR